MYTSLVTENRLTVMIDLIALNGQYLHTLPLILFTLPTIRYKNRHLKQRILSMFQPTKRIRSAGMHFRYVRSRFLGKRFSRDLGVPYSFVVIVIVSQRLGNNAIIRRNGSYAIRRIFRIFIYLKDIIRMQMNIKIYRTDWH